jgi:hypothetical protein
MSLAAETREGEAMSVTLMIVEINGISESRGARLARAID